MCRHSSTGSNTRTRSSSRGSAFSIGTTASAPAGIGAPVAIATASPIPTLASGRCPIIAWPTTLSSVGSFDDAAATSDARSAKPSIAEDANSGRSTAEKMFAAENIFSAVDLPEFASSAMDGFALRASDVAAASSNDPTELKVVGHAMIGQRPEARVGMGEAVAIATGAPIPAGADAVVPIENAEPRDDDLVRVFDPVEEWRHIRPRGADVLAGEILVPIGKRLSAGELGLLANAGVPHPMVHPRPRIVVLSTGDELIPPTDTPTSGQVRDSNASSVFAALRGAGRGRRSRRPSPARSAVRRTRACSLGSR